MSSYGSLIRRGNMTPQSWAREQLGTYRHFKARRDTVKKLNELQAADAQRKFNKQRRLAVRGRVRAALRRIRTGGYGGGYVRS